ncbi:MAG: phosphotransferase [Nitrospirae bacterium]|nr:phosphotransferase [Nitrospirota bacterium]
MSELNVPEQAQKILDRWGKGRVLEVVRLAGDASNRTYFRVFLGDPGGSDRSSVILMVRKAPEGFRGSEEKSAPSEGQPPGDPFVLVAHFLQKNRIFVPSIYLEAEDGDVLIQEDLGAETLSDAFSLYPEKESVLREKAMNLLLDLQSLQTDNEMEWVRKRPFSRELYVWEFDHFLGYGVHGMPSGQESEIRIDFRKMSDTLSATLPEVFLHRDYHSRNLMLTDGQRIALIDFQDMRVGSPLYDLASFLFDAYSPVHPSMLEKIVVEYEKDARKLGILPRSLTTQSFREILAQHAFQRNMKACGRFFYINQVKGNPSYLPSVSRTHQNMTFLSEWEPSLKPLWNRVRPFLKVSPNA